MSAVDVQALLQQNEAARERASKKQALLDEREKADRAGQTGRVSLIDAELERLDAEGPIAVKVVDVEQQRRRAEVEMDRQAHIAALIREREGYERRGDAARVALVDAELQRIAGKGKPPRKRASIRGRRPARPTTDTGNPDLRSENVGKGERSSGFFSASSTPSHGSRRPSASWLRSHGLT